MTELLYLAKEHKKNIDIARFRYIVLVFTIPTNEEVMIARDTVRLSGLQGF
ncbi:hypothetical protein HMPREF1210_00157 [Paenisporosarcina sp. HGH0030]|nr:hypothetical protein HMPREF1210_00157 [Paenisporosarcina sp. HGH0030]